MTNNEIGRLIDCLEMSNTQIKNFVKFTDILKDSSNKVVLNNEYWINKLKQKLKSNG